MYGNYVFSVLRLYIIVNVYSIFDKIYVITKRYFKLNVNLQ